MKLFKKKNHITPCCQGNFSSEQIAKAKDTMQAKGIKVLGSGCIKCNQLEHNVQQALQELQLDIAIEHVTDFSEIALYGVMSTPALVVNNEVVSYGKVLSVVEAKAILEKRM